MQMGIDIFHIHAVKLKLSRSRIRYSLQYNANWIRNLRNDMLTSPTFKNLENQNVYSQIQYS